MLFNIKGRVAFFEELVTPFIILGLADLVFVTEFADVDFTAKAFKHDLGFLLIGPFIGTIEQKSLKKHQVFLKRLERFPLDKAEYYRRLKETYAVKSVRGLSKITGEDWSYIARILKTLDLCDFIKEFLQKKKEDPKMLRYFHLRRLLDIVRQKDERLQLTRFREMMDEFDEG